MTDREHLRDLLVQRSVRLGDFTLASGAKSNYYVDARTTTMSAEGQVLLGKVAYSAALESEPSPTHVGGLTMGADPIAYAIAHRSGLEGPTINGFSVRKEAKEYGTGQRIEGGLSAMARCLIVEDTITTGKSTLEAIGAVRLLGAQVVGVLVLINRSDNAEALFEGLGLPLISLFTGNELLSAARAL